MSSTSKPHSNPVTPLNALARENDELRARVASLEEQVQSYEDEINQRTDDQALTLRKLREEQERADGLKEQYESLSENNRHTHANLDVCIEQRTRLEEQQEVYEENLKAYHRTILDLKEQLEAALDREAGTSDALQDAEARLNRGIFEGQPVEYWLGLKEQLEAAKKALDEIWMKPYRAEEIMLRYRATSNPAKERPLYTNGSLTATPLPPGASNQERKP